MKYDNKRISRGIVLTFICLGFSLTVEAKTKPVTYDSPEACGEALNRPVGPSKGIRVLKGSTVASFTKMEGEILDPCSQNPFPREFTNAAYQCYQDKRFGHWFIDAAYFRTYKVKIANARSKDGQCLSKAYVSDIFFADFGYRHFNGDLFSKASDWVGPVLVQRNVSSAKVKYEKSKSGLVREVDQNTKFAVFEGENAVSGYNGDAVADRWDSFNPTEFNYLVYGMSESIMADLFLVDPKDKRKSGNNSN